MENHDKNLRYLHIKNPCPFFPTQRNKSGANFYCKSCCKTIVDFRGMAPGEIAQVLKKDTCGIFNNDQLPGQQTLSLPRRLALYFFSVLSLFGFYVKPLSAQIPGSSKSTVQVNQKSVHQENVDADVPVIQKETRKEKRQIRRMLRRRRYVGIPSFIRY